MLRKVTDSSARPLLVVLTAFFNLLFESRAVKFFVSISNLNTITSISFVSLDLYDRILSNSVT